MKESDLSLENRTAYKFSILSTLAMRCIAELYTRKFKLSQTGWRIMSIIGRFEPIFPSVAAQLSTIDADQVTRAVDKLVDMQFVVRNSDAADRRRVILCLSSKGRSVYDQIEGASRELEAEWRSVLSEQEWAQFSGVMDKLDVRAKEIFSPEAAQLRFFGKGPAPAKKASARAPRKKTAKGA